jgi:hypothetical protein
MDVEFTRRFPSDRISVFLFPCRGFLFA